MNIEIIKFKIDEKYKVIEHYKYFYENCHNTHRKLKYKDKIDEIIKEIEHLINTHDIEIKNNNYKTRF